MDRVPINAVLLVIDVQKGFDAPRWGVRNNWQAEDNMARILKSWRTTHRPIYHIQHRSTDALSPLHPNNAGYAIKDVVRPLDKEPVITKQVNSAFIGTDLEKRLRQNGYDVLVIVGLTTDHCVSTTTRMAANLGFHCYVIDDATATFGKCDHRGQDFSAEVIHASHLASLHGEFAEVVDTSTLISRLE